MEPWKGEVPSGFGDPGGAAETPGERQSWSSLAANDLAPMPGIVPSLPLGLPPVNSGRSGEPPQRNTEPLTRSGEDAVLPEWIASHLDPYLDPVTPVTPELDEQREERRAVGLPGAGAGIDVRPGAPIETPFVPDPVSTPPPDRVAVVRPAGDDEDFSAWEVGAGLLGLASASALLKGRTKEADREASTPDYTLRESTVWERGVSHASRHNGNAESSPGRFDASDYVPRPFKAEPGEGCAEAPTGDEDLPEDEGTQDEETEEKERRAVDLLKQDDGAWAGGLRPTTLGVIE
ncbi:hypothetical protein Lesp01_81630 [Lentzea sp. NBRC 102530]|nr:hypothetical protein Lesp01_81630 [Lentzea sp. NBRC 102530]